MCIQKSNQETKQYEIKQTSDNLQIKRQIISNRKSAKQDEEHMSTNSNEADELMQEGHQKQTKLQKFLRTIDQQTIKYIRKYRQQNQNSQTQNNKSDKIKLKQDLLIIDVFKTHERELDNKKKIDELCHQLKQKIGFSAATIRERIQKKLSNVTKQDIINHIKLGLNFTFNTKRKLVPVKDIKTKSSKNSKISQDDKNDDIYFQDNPVHRNNISKSSKSSASKPTKTSRTGKHDQKPIQIHSGAQDASNSVQEIPKRKSPRRLEKKQAVPVHHIEVQEDRNFGQVNESGKGLSAKRDQKKNQNRNELFNEFTNWSDHESDEQLIIVKQINLHKQENQGTLCRQQGYRLNTRQGEKKYECLLETMGEQFIKYNECLSQGKLYVLQQSQNRNLNIENQKKINQIKKVTQLRRSTGKLESKILASQNNNNKTNKSKKMTKSDTINQLDEEDESKQKYIGQDEQIYYNSQSEKQFIVANTHTTNQKEEHNQSRQPEDSSWHPDQDQFLKQILGQYQFVQANKNDMKNRQGSESGKLNQNVDQSEIRCKLQVLKRYKQANSILGRAKYLKINPNNAFMIDLFRTAS